jgi:ribosome-binding protein aMBF1 (putative translation factor)
MAKKKLKKKTSNILGILEDRYFASPEAQAEIEEARASAQVARQIYALRTDAGLTQRELATMIGTKHPVICRLEDDDYEGHSLSMLRRIAKALGKRVEIHFVPDPEVKSA